MVLGKENIVLQYSDENITLKIYSKYGSWIIDTDSSVGKGKFFWKFHDNLINTLQL